MNPKAEILELRVKSKTVFSAKMSCVAKRGPGVNFFDRAPRS